MKVKTIKEKDNMEEEVLGVKVKQEEVEETVENLEDEVAPAEDIEEDQPTEEIHDEDIFPEPSSPEEFFNEVVDTVPEEKEDGYKRVATARLFDNHGTTIYRFDIYNKEFSKNNGLVEFRNIVNNFDAARPDDAKEYKEFFAMFGIIKWNFANTTLPYDKNILAVVTQLESLINEHIRIAGIKKNKFEFRVDVAD